MASTRISLLIAVCSLGVAAVVAQRKTGPLFSNPCWDKRCHDYATCQVINSTQAVCMCPQNCTSLRKPVCGTNWKTYDNLCSLMAEACAKNDLNVLRYNGECKAGDCRNSIWQTLNCPYYSRCLLHFGFPRCECSQEQCPMNYEPLCATDGRTYRNTCHMRQGSCRKKKLLQVRNLGHCKPDPCRSHECCCGAVCRVNETNYASCSCDFTCSQQSSQVCGSDGTTYNSPCDLRLAACREQNMKLTQVSNGPCLLGQISTPSPGGKPRDACLHQVCPYHGTCIVEQGLAKCICPACPLTRSPVCGSNGVTYDNECTLRKASCVALMTITVANIGACGSVVEPTSSTRDPCSWGQCAHYGTCIVVRGSPTCVCPDLCPQVMAPLCGSDGVTYENDCALRRASCKSEKTIIGDSRGPCEVKPTTEPAKPTMDPCFEQSCTYHAECIVDRGLPKCVCPSNCPNTSAPVCGSDGITYGSECAMKKESCTKQLTITVASAGRCACDNVNCCCGSVCKVRNNTGVCECDFVCSAQLDPVCGSDGKTYDNECVLRLTACRDSIANLKQASRGRCPVVTPTVNPCALGMCAFDAVCLVIQGEPTCICPEPCPNVFSPRCGSDGQTYQNDCDLKIASCEKQMVIRAVKNGPCDPTPTRAPTSSNPCSGMTCKHFSTCEVVQGVAKCVCPSLCPGVVLAVCGSDGKTYENECALRRTSCLAGMVISIVRIGVCLRTQTVLTQAPVIPATTLPRVGPTTSNLCRFGRCAHYGVCQVFQGTPRCVCPTCSGPKSPVCGSDGRTYDSECELMRSSCDSQTTITILKSGFCEPVGRCPTPQLCPNQCNQDICSRSGKTCCCQGCGLACTTLKWDAGRFVCPPDPLGCRNDGDCSGGLICCDAGCMKRCIAPRP